MCMWKAKVPFIPSNLRYKLPKNPTILSIISFPHCSKRDGMTETDPSPTPKLPLIFSLPFSFSPFFLIRMIEVILNDRLGRKIRVKCNPSDTIGDLKKLVAAQTGERKEKEMTRRNAPREDSHSKVVHHLQGSHHPRGLRNPRRNGPGTVL